MNNAPRFALAALVLGMIVYNMVFFRLGEWQTAVVLQFGKPVKTVFEPGLHTKTPFVQNVVFFEKRLLDYDAAPRELITKDKQQLVVDNFSRWRVIDPLLFYKSVLTEAGAQSRLDDIIYSALRESVARVTLTDVVSGDRQSLLDFVTKESNKKATTYGIEVVDVRIKRTELPEKNEQNVFRRMRTERERQAKKFRAEGEEESRKIRSLAERERRILLAEAQREAELIRGKGEAESIAIYAGAYEAAPEFYKFQRTLQAYEKALAERATVVLTPDSEFLSTLETGR